MMIHKAQCSISNEMYYDIQVQKMEKEDIIKKELAFELAQKILECIDINVKTNEMGILEFSVDIITVDKKEAEKIKAIEDIIKG